MRIAIFTEAFLPKTDGVVNTLLRVLEHLAARGHCALVFAPEGGPPRYANAPIIGLPALPFPLYPELKLTPPTVDVSDRLAAFRPDLVHLVNPVALGLAGMRAARQLGIPVAASYQTDLPGFAARWGLGMFSGLLEHYLRWVHNQADLNFCPSEFTRRELERQGIARLRVWGRGVDSELFSPRQASPSWRSRLTAGRLDEPLVLTVGRLAVEKRLDWLRPVIAALPAVRLAIVGDGPQRSTLTRLFERTPTVFTGYLRGLQLAAAYASSDIFVLTGANETLGNVVLEAMASGLPVVVPDAGGQVDHVRHGENGLVYAAESQDALAAAVERLVGDPMLRHRLGQAGRAYALTLTWPRILDGLIADWESLLPQARFQLAA